MSDVKPDEVREAVRKNYAAAAKRGAAPAEDCGCSASPCCGSAPVAVDATSLQLGYSADELKAVPEGANLGLGCGNPQAIAALKAGETVLDLGSGAGLDAFLAARQVGPSGRVIGVDMTPEMVTRARENARKGGYANVEFRLGEVEHLPVADGSVDVVLSNCVINLSPDKPQVFRDAFRVLKPGGRLAISDVVRTAELPAEVRKDWAMMTGCVAGAAGIDEVTNMLGEAGFTDIRIKPKDASREFIATWFPGGKIEDYVVSATIEAIKVK